MFKQMTKFLKGSLKRKLIITISFSIIIPFLFSAIYYYKSSEETLKAKISETNANSVYQVGYYLENFIYEISSASSMISQDIDILNILNREYQTEIEKIKDRIKIKEFFSNVKRNIFTTKAEIITMGFNNIIDATCLFDKGKSDFLYKTTWYKEIVDHNGSFYWFSSLRSDMGIIEDSSKKILCMGRLVKDLKGENCGILIVVVDWQQLYDSMQKLMLSEEQDFFIVESEKRVIMNSENLVSLDLSAVLSQASKGGNSTFMLRNSGRPLLINLEKLKNSNWKIVLVTSYKYMFREIDMLKNNLIILTILMFVIFVFLVFFIIHKSFLPVKELENTMKIVHDNNFNVRVNVDSNDEIGNLAKSFNSMIERIKRLISENHEKQLRLFSEERDKERLKLLVMQAQINPHFLFNTLNNIKWIAVANNANKVADYITAVGSLLEQSIKIADDEILIREELSYLKEFVKISKLRYRNLFEVIYDIEDCILENKILKLVLQPIVENAIIHGISKTDRQGKIIVCGYRIKESIIFLVEDNGGGMERKYAQNLLGENEEDSPDKFNQLGVYNTNKRIKLNYGGSYGLIIESEVGCYTRIKFVLPIIE